MSGERASEGTLLASDPQVSGAQDDGWIDEAEKLLGYQFENSMLLKQALTHRSFVHESSGKFEHNERLEFLGDAVLGFVAAQNLYLEFPEAPEGELTRRRAAYVSEVGIAHGQRPQALGHLVRMGKGQARAGGHKLPSIMSDATEAVIAAVFLDGGLEKAAAVIGRLLGPLPNALALLENPKSKLQERLQSLLGEAPSYEAERAGGPDHAPRFSATVYLRQKSRRQKALGSAEGANKKEASLAAAAEALLAIDPLDDEALLLYLDTDERGAN